MSAPRNAAEAFLRGYTDRTPVLGLSRRDVVDGVPARPAGPAAPRRPLDGVCFCGAITDPGLPACPRCLREMREEDEDRWR